MAGRTWIGLAAALVLAGCSATSIDFDSMTAADLAAQPQYMMIVPSVPKTASVVGPVDVEICNKKRSDPVPTDDSVLLLLKTEAARKGATALADVSFRVTPEGTDSCFSHARASGTAFMRQ
jgi:hypothetical protein